MSYGIYNGDEQLITHFDTPNELEAIKLLTERMVDPSVVMARVRITRWGLSFKFNGGVWTPEYGTTWIDRE